MKRIIKRLTAVLAALVLVVGSFAFNPVEAKAEGLDLESASAILFDVNTGTVLYEKNADEKHYPASITKILTVLLAVENSDLNEPVTFSDDAISKNEGDTSHIFRDYGEVMTMEQCVYAVMLESANECAYAVAEHIGMKKGGDYQTFIDMMNDRTKALGGTGTHFNNANGLPDENHYTTARDMGLIACEAIKNPTFRQICGTRSYKIPPTNKHTTETPLNNHHRMFSNYKGSEYIYPYAIGGKTGYTVVAGNTLVTFAEKDGMLLAAVVMACPSAPYPDTKKLFEYGFNNFKEYNVAENETRFNDGSGQKAGLFGETDAFAKVDSNATICLPKSAAFYDTEVKVEETVGTGNVLGTLDYYYNGKLVGSADILTTEVNGMSYEFGNASEIYSDVEAADYDLSISVAEKEDEPEETALSELFSQLPVKKIAIAAAAVIIVIIIIVIIIIIRNHRNNTRRRNRRRRKLDDKQMYKTITKSKEWNKRGKGF